MWKRIIFWSEIGSGFGEPVSTSPPRISRSTHPQVSFCLLRRCFFFFINFLVTCPRLDPNDGITARGRACMSPEETVVVSVQRFYTDVAKTSISNFRQVGTAFSSKLPQARTVLLFSSYTGQFFPRRNLLTRRRK